MDKVIKTIADELNIKEKQVSIRSGKANSANSSPILLQHLPCGGWGVGFKNLVEVYSNAV